MGNVLFGVDISGLIAEHVGPGLLEVTVTRQPSSTERGEKLTDGLVPAKPSVFKGRGMWDNIERSLIDGVEVLVTDRKALLIGDAFPTGFVPTKGDHVEIESIKLVMVKLLRRDPAAATYELACRAQKGGT